MEASEKSISRSTRKSKTSKLPQGGEYAYVADRLKEFRQDCPNGLVETTPTILDEGTVIMFTARVLKDKSKPESAEATGHAMGKNDKPKAFEKIETQAVGRALALLGYLASGEIASADEMADYLAYRQDKIDEIVGTIKNFDSIEDLKKYFLSLGAMMAEEEIIKAKDAKKAELVDDSPKV